MSSHSPSQHPPISPPKTRSASAEDSTAALVEDWRTYTQKLRSQNEGERAHMAADRARMEEVMAEERALWDKERDILKARIAELEAQLGKKGSSPTIPLPTRPQPAMSFASPGSTSVSVTGSIDASSRSVPQESGRNADGSPFYAPAPRHPSRTFDPSEAEEMRVDSITAPRESVIRVTSKELTSSDFGIQSPPSGHDLETINESPAESIDISHIQPGLEGVSIKASAVSPTFISKVMSPRSPSKLSPDIKPPARDITNQVRSPSKEDKDRKTLEVACQPENRRLTMHAGHTPNHSVSKFSFFGGDADSGNATPTQEYHEVDNLHRPSIAPEYHGETEEETDGDDHGDKELSGPLGLTNEKSSDDPFLAELVEKLEVEARKSADASPTSETGRSSSPRKRMEQADDEEKDEGPRLRLRPSTNFGRPLGSM
ncbi:hypothetical protein BKA65DRAFT_413681 [Rhexocercosporidium sp. MPI-PUGE-AT-0058]|nr:hypothetical protein BKA65DRAFT_413681 [Rhexocercosporidium sp. MPI-PUGE-AT-0058]